MISEKTDTQIHGLILALQFLALERGEIEVAANLIGYYAHLYREEHYILARKEMACNSMAMDQVMGIAFGEDYEYEE